ncbi:MAG: AsmA-like C-terminal region-containing protein [Verrucomicrobiae bacterium]|nr:AsmA-like C-terminal region-containing protein [Verrucomicrobiae bacterium]
MPGFWRKCRIAFRWARYCLWLLLVLALLALAWINVVGFPGFVKQRVQAALQDHGVTLEFSRMRWRFIHGIVAENVIIGDRQVRSDKPVFTAGQIQLRLDYGALAHRKFQLTGVVVRDGIFTLPVNPTNRLVVLNLQAEVSFRPDETWSLDELRADFSGVKIRLAGQVAHAPELLKWQVFAGQKTSSRSALAHPLQDLSTTLAKIRFDQPPQINVTLHGDARDVHSFLLFANANTPAVTTPWFSARGLQLAASLAAPADAPANSDASLDFWTNALPFRVAWTVRATQLALTNLDAGTVECDGIWSAPQLALSRLSAHPGGGEINLSAALDVTTRELAFTNASIFDPHLLKPFLPAAARDRLADILWTRPPSLTLDGQLTCPAWTNRTVDLSELIGPACVLHGVVASTNAVVRGLTVELARTHFNYANLIWSAPDLQLALGRTHLAISAEASAATENFRAALRGYLDAGTVRPFLPTNLSAPLFRLVRLDEPVALDFASAGNLLNLPSISATGHVAVTNVSIREQAYESVVADVVYSNRVLQLLHPESRRDHGTQIMTADSVVLDWNAGMYFFKNGFSTTDPMAVVRAIGPKTAAIIAPYHFSSPPTARVNGQLPLRDLNRGRDLDGTDMTFEILHGGPFQWSKLSTPNITGIVHWTGQQLYLTNVAADFYGGTTHGNASFDFRPVGYDCDFKFEVFMTNVDVHLLGEALSTNQSKLIDGRLAGHLAVTDADTRTWRSWNGYGDANLHDGLLWSIPIFGFASPVLNTVTPGLGNSRATDAAMKFVMTNGVIRSDLLEIHTLTMRLQYAGTMDLEQNANARVTAQFMRNTPVIGSVISLVLFPFSKIFECQVTGQISEPTVTPIYFPFSKYLLHPIHTFEQIIPDAPKG